MGYTYLPLLKRALSHEWILVEGQVLAAKADKAKPIYQLWNKRYYLPLAVYAEKRCCTGCFSYALEVLKEFFQRC